MATVVGAIAPKIDIVEAVGLEAVDGVAGAGHLHPGAAAGSKPTRTVFQRGRAARSVEGPTDMDAVVGEAGEGHMVHLASGDAYVIHPTFVAVVAVEPQGQILPHAGVARYPSRGALPNAVGHGVNADGGEGGRVVGRAYQPQLHIVVGEAPIGAPVVPKTDIKVGESIHLYQWQHGHRLVSVGVIRVHIQCHQPRVGTAARHAWAAVVHHRAIPAVRVAVRRTGLEVLAVRRHQLPL